MHQNSGRLFLAACVAAFLALSAGCGGGGGGGSDSPGASNGNGSALTPGTNQVAGPADPIQDALTQGSTAAEGAPVVGNTASAFTGSLVSLLDAPDGLAAAFQDFATSMDPQALINGGQDSGAALQAFAANLTAAVQQLQAENAQIPGADPIPGSDAIPGADEVLAQLATLQGLLDGGGDGGAPDLAALTDNLDGLSGALDVLSGNIPAGVQDAPVIGGVLTALADNAGSLSGILGSAGDLDAAGFNDGLLASFEDVQTNLTGLIPGADGFDTGLGNATDLAQLDFTEGLGLLTDPLFQGLNAVQGGNDLPFADVLAGLVSGDIGDVSDVDGIGGLDGLTGLLAGGGLDSNGLPIPTAQQAFAGLPLLGDLLAAGIPTDGLDAGALDALNAGGLDALTAVLNGGGGLPSLGDALQGLPGLAGPGGGPASLPLVGDLLTTLLDASDGTPPDIATIFDAAGDGNGGLDTSAIGGVFGDLLDSLVGMAGGVDATGGFLDGFSGIPDVGGLLGGLLGNLT